MATLKGLKKRALRVRSRWMPYARVQLATGDSIIVDLRDEGGLHLAVWGGERAQPVALNAWRALLERGAWDLVVDVGANYGEFTIPATQGGAFSVIAIEPNPSVSACLARTVAGVAAPAGVFAVAAGATHSLAELRVDGNSRTGQTVADGDHADADVVVPVVPLDDIIGWSKDGSGELGPLLMKIDVEGFELDVLTGAQRTLEQVPAAALLIEALHVGAERLMSALPGFEAWAFDRGANSFVQLESVGSANRGTLDTRDVLFVRGVAVKGLV